MMVITHIITIISLLVGLGIGIYTFHIAKEEDASILLGISVASLMVVLGAICAYLVIGLVVIIVALIYMIIMG